MSSRSVLFLALAWLLLSPALPAQQGEDFELIVNSANPIRSLTKAQVSSYFLKSSRQWPQGSSVAPVDLGANSEVRKSFSLVVVHGRDVAAIRAYWQRLIFQGRDIPPPTRADDREVVAFVAENTGAIGYVRKNAVLPDTVKVLILAD